MMRLARFYLNGIKQELVCNGDRSLLDVIRSDFGLTGTKRGCETVSCGACTVMVNGMAVKGCSVLAMQVDGMKVTTVEGLEKNGKLDPIQTAFLDEGAFQCGFCTSGMLMSAKAFLDETPKPKDEMEIRRAMEGNLCRCTGYNAIIRAIDAVAKGNYREDKR